MILEGSNTIREKVDKELHCRSYSQEKVWLLTHSGKHNAACSHLQENGLCPRRFVGYGKNERMLNSKRCPNHIRREQELLNFLTYYHSWMRPPVIFAAYRVLGALESVCQQHLVAHTTVHPDFYAGNAAVLWSKPAVFHWQLFWHFWGDGHHFKICTKVNKTISG